jgi:hypothetical protein
MYKYDKEFTGVWIPKSIWENKELGWTEKMLLVEIKSLDNANGCYALNDHFSNFFGLSKDRISKMVTELRRLDYIDVELKYKEGTKQVIGRIIRVNINKYEGMGDNTDRYGRKILEAIGENADTPIGENDEDNNTISFNNTINNTKDIKNISEVATQTSQVEKVDLIHEQALRVFDFYVGITKSKIKPSATHLKEVKGRLKDKVITEQECYEIIKFKHVECVRSGNFKYFTLVSMFRASNVPNTLQAIELMKNGMGMEFKDRNNFNKGHQPYVSPSHQVTQEKELIQILEEELPF